MRETDKESYNLSIEIKKRLYGIIYTPAPLSPKTATKITMTKLQFWIAHAIITGDYYWWLKNKENNIKKIVFVLIKKCFAIKAQCVGGQVEKFCQKFPLR